MQDSFCKCVGNCITMVTTEGGCNHLHLNDLQGYFQCLYMFSLLNLIFKDGNCTYETITSMNIKRIKNMLLMV